VCEKLCVGIWELVPKASLMHYVRSGWGIPPVEHVGSEWGFYFIKPWPLSELIKSSLRQRYVLDFIKALIDSGASLEGRLISILKTNGYPFYLAEGNNLPHFNFILIRTTWPKILWLVDRDKQECKSMPFAAPPPSPTISAQQGCKWAGLSADT
jgi:hypothetical protein